MSDLHGEIMNIPCNYTGGNAREFKEGHRDARHSAAELALGAEDRAYAAGRADEREESAKLLEALKTIDARLRECMPLFVTAADVYDSFYQEVVAEALAAYECKGVDSGGTGAREGDPK